MLTRRARYRACAVLYSLLRHSDEALLPWRLAEELGLGAVPDDRPPTGSGMSSAGAPWLS